MKRRIWMALALAGALTGGLLSAAPHRHILPPDTSDKGDYWASIAYSKRTGVYGFAINGKTRDEVEKAALSQIKASDAVMVRTFKNGWVGLVISDGGDYDYIEGETRTGISREENIHKAEERASKKGGELVLLVGHAGFIRQKSPVHSGDHYAAIARSEKTDLFGYSFGCDSQEEAEKQALKFAGNPKGVATISAKTWCALADSRDGWGLATADSEDEATDKALDDAVTKHATSARVVLLVSGDGFLVRYPDGPMEGNGSAR